MEYVYPSYYREFQCVGGRCPDTCCAGWEIVIDDKSLRRYRTYAGGFGNRLRNSIDFKKKSFKQYGRRCAFLNEDNLCDIYAEAGQHMLCKTCRNYPRHVEEYENVREWSLSLSCPEAARLILSQDGLKLYRLESRKQTEDEEDFDDLLFSQLLDARNVLFEIIRKKAVPIETRMMMILSLAHHLQRNISEGQLFGMEAVYEKYLRPDAGDRCRQYMERQWRLGIKADSRAMDYSGVRSTEKVGMAGDETSKIKEDASTVRYHMMRGMFHSLHKLEVLSESWPGYIRHCEKILFGQGKRQYEAICDWQMPVQMKEQLLSYFIYVYFAGAVYDGRPYVKVKLAAVSVMLIEDLLRVTCTEKGRVSLEDAVEAAHRYAREVEHSDVNLHRMDVMLSREKCFHIGNIMAVLLTQARQR